MKTYSKCCDNCGATIAINITRCDRCNAHIEHPETGQPHFSDEARKAGQSLGGLLKLYTVNGIRVRYIGWCPAGAFGLDASGEIIWLEDWGYMATLTIEQAELRFAGKLADVDTGKLL